MTVDLNAEREKVVLPQGAKEGSGVAPQAAAVPTHVLDESFGPQAVNTVLDQVVRQVKPEPNLLSVAKLLGAAYFVGQVKQASDTAFEHDLRRIPGVVLLAVDLSGQGGTVLGVPAGSPVSNANPWSQSTIYVRATHDGRYAFLVI